MSANRRRDLWSLERCLCCFVPEFQSAATGKIQEDYERLNENIHRIFDIVDESKAVETYLEGDMNQGRTILELNEQLKDTRSLFQDIPSNLVLIGVNGAPSFKTMRFAINQ